MMLVEPNRARSEPDEVQAELKGILERGGASIVNLEKWEERKLVYPIHNAGSRVKRAAYFLSHFEADPSAVERIERAFRLSELVLRALVIRDEDGPEIVRVKDYEESNRPAIPDDVPDRPRRSRPQRPGGDRRRPAARAAN